MDQAAQGFHPYGIVLYSCCPILKELTGKVFPPFSETIVVNWSGISSVISKRDTLYFGAKKLLEIEKEKKLLKPEYCIKKSKNLYL
jgi:hypothetical protein